MAETPSNMIPLGTVAPDFNLISPITGETVSYSNCKGEKGTLVMFICNHCPYVVLVAEAISELAKDYQNKGFGVVAISSNDVGNYPEDSPEKMITFAKENDFTFPYLYDETQKVAHAYKAACTPDFYLFDGEDLLYYRGQMDDARPGNHKTNDGNDLRNAMDAILNGHNRPQIQKPSCGCNIKWFK
ncbi:MAG: thioredoxin family protein [Lentisphaeria bacterium]|nr:thioredoxin family protein [Lentisphaeria bacterium]